MSKKKYIGSPEAYMIVAEKHEIDIDALNCVLSRAYGVCVLLMANFTGEGPQHNDDILCNAAWTLEGLIEQAQILVEGKEE